MFTLPTDHLERMERVRLALDGLSLGDSFGEQFIYWQGWTTSLELRQLPPSPWKYTDDTEMALGIAEVLAERGTIDQDRLATVFMLRYALHPHRGYGSGAHEVLYAIGRGEPWRSAAHSVFHGQGSLGNGGAMRAAPVGAYFAGDGYIAVVEEARRSAEVTHAHPEGIAGAIAVAVAAAWGARRHNGQTPAATSDLFATILEHVPPGETRSGIERAAQLPLDAWQFDAAQKLGNGDRVTAADTVPFCLWMAARHLDDFTQALWNAVYVGGDIDTNCAIIGGIVALAVGREGLPHAWLAHREPLQWESGRV